MSKGIDMAKVYDVKYLDTKYILDRNGLIRWTGAQILDPSSLGVVMKHILGT
ncbi:MAG: hypothetical protein ACREBA_01625 [Nitrosotalea sp.]